MMTIKYREGFSILPDFGSTDIPYSLLSLQEFEANAAAPSTSHTYAVPTMEPNRPGIIDEILHGIRVCLGS